MRAASLKNVLRLSFITTLFATTIASAQDRPLPGDLNLEGLKRIDANAKSEAAYSSDGEVLGWTCFDGAFDLDPAAPTGLFILNLKTGSPFPAVKKRFFNRNLTLIAIGYKDPSTGLVGDIYETILPDTSRRYFMFAPRDSVSSTGKSIVFYDSAGKVTHYSNAFVAAKEK